jgi:hypothetical protein
MTTITVHAKDKKHLSKIKAALKLIDTVFEEKEEVSETTIFDTNLEKLIIETRKEKANGMLKIIDPSNIWKSIGL